MTKTVYIVKIEDYDCIIDEAVFDNFESAEKLVKKLEGQNLDYHIGLYTRLLYSTENLEFMRECYTTLATIDFDNKIYDIRTYKWPAMRNPNSYTMYMDKKTNMFLFTYSTNISAEFGETELRKIIAQHGINLEEFESE